MPQIMGFVAGSDVLKGMSADGFTAKSPLLFSTSLGVSAGPGRLTLLGGSSGPATDALALLTVFDALLESNDLNAIIAHSTLSPTEIFERQLARLSKNLLSSLQERTVGHRSRPELEVQLARLQDVGNRLTFAMRPIDFAAVEKAVGNRGTGLLLIDQVQATAPKRRASRSRGQAGPTIAELRRLADRGTAVIGIMTARSKCTECSAANDVYDLRPNRKEGRAAVDMIHVQSDDPTSEICHLVYIPFLELFRLAGVTINGNRIPNG